MTHLLSIEQIRKIECIYREVSPSLMQRAGHQAAEWILGKIQRHQRILILVGPGRNGSDGLILASVLLQSQIETKVFQVYPDNKQHEESAQAHRSLPGVAIISELDRATLDTCDVIIDAIFGIGLTGKLDARCAAISQLVSSSGKRVIALDVPSGVNADTGYADPHSFSATDTLTFIADKPGLHTGAALDYCGKIHTLNLNLPAQPERDAGDNLPDTAEMQRLARGLNRQKDRHKGWYGSVVIAGSNDGMQGAGMLAARSALHAGAGKTHLVQLADSAITVDPLYPEIMCHSMHKHASVLNNATHCVIGPGLGCTETSLSLLHKVTRLRIPVVFDADALNLLAGNPEQSQITRQRPSNSTIFTPHPLEAARLLNCSTNEIQANRLAAAREISARYAVTCVLKGAGTVITTPSGQLFINTTGNAALSTAGQGDILAGLIAALWAQGLDAKAAAQLGVYVHGLAADRWRECSLLGVGLGSSETFIGIRNALNGLARG